MVEKFDADAWTGRVEVDGQEIELALVDDESMEGEAAPDAATELEPLPDGMYDVEPRVETSFREGFDLAQDQADAMLINKKIDSMLANDESVNLEKLRNSPEDTVDRHLEKFREEKKWDEVLEDTQLVEYNQEAEKNLAETVEKFEANLAALDQIPESVLNSPEGKEATLSLRDKITSKLTGFKDGLKEKFTSLSDNGGEKIIAVLGGLTGAAFVGPILLQAARTKWPEVGVMLDAGPDMLQQFIHVNMLTELADLLLKSSPGEFQDLSQSILESNLIADLSSGKETFDNLSQEQLELLQDRFELWENESNGFEILLDENKEFEILQNESKEFEISQDVIDKFEHEKSDHYTHLVAKASGNGLIAGVSSLILGRLVYKISEKLK